MRRLLSLLVVVQLLTVGASIETVKLSTGSGELLGKRITATYSPYGNQSSIAFLGVPYAQPPVGELRFRRPLRLQPWSGVFNATQNGAACMSDVKSTYKETKDGPISEDCLVMNIFTNDFCIQSKSCAVLVVIHGGRFLAEAAATFKEDVITNNFAGENHNIVVVVVQYRLGLFGTLNFNSVAMSKGIFDGNMLYYDIVEALHWVQREVSNFGGDRDRVTLLGHSAGAALVATLSTSSLTKGLYKQQVAMSSPSMEISKATNSKFSRRVAIDLGCLAEDRPTDNLPRKFLQETVDCLRRIDAKELLRVQQDVLNNKIEQFVGPFIDGETLTDFPEVVVLDKLRYQKRETLIGTVSAEMRDTRGGQDENGNPISSRVSEFCSHQAFGAGYERPVDFQTVCELFYNRPDKPKKMSDDRIFYTPTVNMANANLGSSYVYSYTFNGAGEAFKKYQFGVPSPSHSEDYIYIFGTHRGVFKARDYVIEKTYSGLIANFINFGDPSPSKEQPWPKWTEEGNDYFHIDFDDENKMPGAKKGYYEDADFFWNFLAPKFGGKLNRQKDFDTPSFDTFVTYLLGPILGTLQSVEQLQMSGSLTVPLTITLIIEDHLEVPGSHWINASLDHGKSLKNVDTAYEEWTYALQQRKLDYFVSHRDLEVNPSSGLQTPEEPPAGLLRPDSLNDQGMNKQSLVTWPLAAIAVLSIVLALFVAGSISKRNHNEYNRL